MSSSTHCGWNRWACSITSAAVGPSVVSTLPAARRQRELETDRHQGVVLDDEHPRRHRGSGRRKRSTNDVPPPRRARTPIDPPCSTISPPGDVQAEPRPAALARRTHAALEHALRAAARGCPGPGPRRRPWRHHRARFGPHLDRRPGACWRALSNRATTTCAVLSGRPCDLDAARQEETNLEPGRPGRRRAPGAIASPRSNVVGARDVPVDERPAPGGSRRPGPSMSSSTCTEVNRSRCSLSPAAEASIPNSAARSSWLRSARPSRPGDTSPEAFGASRTAAFTFSCHPLPW